MTGKCRKMPENTKILQENTKKSSFIVLWYKYDVWYDIFMMRPSSKKWFASVQISCFWIFLETIYTANLNRKNIAENVLAFVHTFKSKGVKTVYFAEICERGKFPKDPKLTKKSFNAQRKKINKIMNNSGAVKSVNFVWPFGYFSSFKPISDWLICVSVWMN